MDARLHPASAFGLDLGDAHVIRNAGGVVTDDVIRSVSISQHHLGTTEVMLVHHTQCGMLTFTDEEFAQALEQEAGERPTWAARTFQDLEQDVRDGVERIRQSPLSAPGQRARVRLRRVHRADPRGRLISPVAPCYLRCPPTRDSFRRPMPWPEVFIVFLISHLVGDYMLQTEWQALNKRGGLNGTTVQQRALFSHIATYTLAYVPALIWLWPDEHGWVFVIAVAIAIPHLVQDDGRLLADYSRIVKKADIRANPSLSAALDQSFHMLALFITAIIVGH